MTEHARIATENDLFVPSQAIFDVNDSTFCVDMVQIRSAT